MHPFLSLQVSGKNKSFRALNSGFVVGYHRYKPVVYYCYNESLDKDEKKIMKRPGAGLTLIPFVHE